MADVTEILSRQHREVESLFEQFDAAASDDQRGALARAIVENLSEHAALEEMTVYPEIEHDVGDDAADALRDEHQQLKEVLAVIDSLAPGDPEFIGHMHEARHLVQQHVDEEENAVFPRFRQSVSQEKLDSLGDKVEVAVVVGADTSPPERSEHPAGEQDHWTGGRTVRQGARRHGRRLTPAALALRSMTCWRHSVEVIDLGEGARCRCQMVARRTLSS
jgi:hemerythrin-like domain-containing protein